MTPPISARTATLPASQLLAPFLRPFQNPATFRLISVMWLIALASMIFGGMAITPFHPDEATQIAMSRDYADLFLTGNLDAVRYQPTPVDAAAQELQSCCRDSSGWVPNRRRTALRPADSPNNSFL